MYWTHQRVSHVYFALLTLEGSGQYPILGKLFLYSVYNRWSVILQVRKGINTLPVHIQCVINRVNILIFLVICSLLCLPWFRIRSGMITFKRLCACAVWKLRQCVSSLPLIFISSPAPHCNPLRWACTAFYLQLIGNFLFCLYYCIWIIACSHQFSECLT